MKEIIMTKWGNWLVPDGTIFADYQKAKEYFQAYQINNKKEWEKFWKKYPEKGYK